jgi:DNA-binding PadR family transcriptional regulator
MHSTELLKGTLQTIILKVLADHGKMYGYEITQRVKDLSEGTIHLAGLTTVEEKVMEFAAFIRTMRHVLNLRAV